MNSIKESGKNNKDKSINDVLTYLLIIMAVYISGNPLFRMLRFELSVIVVFAVSFFFFLVKRLHKPIGSSSFFVCFVLIMSVSCTLVFKGMSSPDTYIAIILQILAGFFIANILSRDQFEKSYISFMNVIMFISLFMFFLQKLFPTVWTFFPQEKGSLFTYVNVGYVYNYFYLPSQGSYILQRNSGVFWEPGCYQFFLNLAIVLMISHERKCRSTLSQNSFILLLFYVVTIITTQSTTGLFLMFLTLFFNGKFILTIFKNGKLFSRNKMFALLGVLIATWVFIKNNFIASILGSLSKINSDTYMGGNGLIERLSLSSFGQLGDSFLHLFGVSYEALYSRPNYFVWNSILEDAMALGIPFVLIVIWGLLKYARKLSYNRVVLSLVFLISLSAESLFHSIFIFLFVFMGFNTEKNVQDSIENHYSSRIN